MSEQAHVIVCMDDAVRACAERLTDALYEISTMSGRKRYSLAALAQYVKDNTETPK